MTLSYTFERRFGRGPTNRTDPMTTRGTDARRLSRAVVGMLAALLVHGSMPDVARGADPPSALAARELARQYGGTPADYRLLHERTASEIGRAHV